MARIKRKAGADCEPSAEGLVSTRMEPSLQSAGEEEAEPATPTLQASEVTSSPVIRPPFTKDQLQKMLVREDELRLCPETQAAYAEAERSWRTDWMQVTIKLQEQVMREHGVSPFNMQAALRCFRSGPHEYPDLKPLALYHRHQRSREGPLCEGDLVPNVLLLNLDGSRTCLMNHEGLKDRAAMLAVYITEAHAMDEWPISSARCNGDRGPVNVLQPSADEERCSLARTFCKNFELRVPMVVDPVSNPFDVDFAPWPIRFYIIHQGKLFHKVRPGLLMQRFEDMRHLAY
ncbi:hypothetical protein WJX84_003907 [Apatococcus fuscideae]|uniref:Iodothyronine deiodinase n=1 Tax=Apatococcus fuscideae TaxID=2026836 RepID=A0AAW1TFH5_9CHLO